MEWLTTLIEKHTDEEGKFNQEAFMEEHKKEFPKHAVIKEDFNSKVNELKQANDTLETLKKDHKDVEELQQTIDQHQGKIKELEEEKHNQAKEFALKEQLSKAGVVYPELLLSSYKEKVELDDEGNLKGFDELIKEDKATKPKLFENSSEETKKNDNNGFKFIENKLDDGDKAPELTKEEINAIKDPVKRVQAIRQNPEVYKRGT